MQVRDILHVDDLLDAIFWQMKHLDVVVGKTFQLGGGRENAVSLLDLTALCEKVTGAKRKIGSDPKTRPGDIKWYVSDARVFKKLSGWCPQRSVEQVVADTYEWIKKNESLLLPIFNR